LISVFESEDSEDDFESKKEQEVLKSESEDEKQDDMLQDEVSDAEVEESIRESERKRLIKYFFNFFVKVHVLNKMLLIFIFKIQIKFICCNKIIYMLN
jgi:hypothetical protein